MVDSPSRKRKRDQATASTDISHTCVLSTRPASELGPVIGMFIYSWPSNPIGSLSLQLPFPQPNRRLLPPSKFTTETPTPLRIAPKWTLRNRALSLQEKVTGW